MAFAPPGNLLATLATPNKEVRLWDTKTGARVRVLAVPGNGTNTEDGKPDTAVIEGMAFSADGTRIALSAMITSGSEQATHIAIFDTGTGALLRTLHAQRHYSYGSSYGRSGALHFTPQGKGIVAVDSNGHVDLWNTATDDPPTPLIEKATPGPSALADGGNLLLMGTPSLDVWDLRTRTLTREFRGEGTTVERARMAKGGSALAVTRVDRVDLYRLTDRSYLTLRLAPPPTLGPVIIADNGAFSGANSAVGQLRVRDGAELEVRSLRPSEITSLNRASIGLDFAGGCPIAPPQ
jgi:WD40 repeat protein